MSEQGLPTYVPRDVAAERLPEIFPEGTPQRNYCTREMAASTVFTMLYIGAIEGSGRYLAPKHVYRMTEAQARKPWDEERLAYADNALRPGFHAPGERWYADNTREPIRDETLREGLLGVGAVIQRTDLPTTSSKPRYALKASFAALFDPTLTGEPLANAIADWREDNLSKSALTRIALTRQGATLGHHEVPVTFPNGEARRLAAGPSSVISKAVIENFAGRFLIDPVVLWVSESGNKVVTRDDTLATRIGLRIEADKNLPDIVLVDLGPQAPLVIFVEVVATDGAVTERRKQALLDLTDAAEFARADVAFVTAYFDRDSAGFKKTVPHLAWGSFAWFANEPGQLLHFREGSGKTTRLNELVERET